MDGRWGLRLVLVAALGLGSAGAGTPAFAQGGSAEVDCWGMHFEIANPSPGSRVSAGRYVVQGVAVDWRAEDGSPGVDSVDFFLGSRDAGGLVVGHAIPAGAGPVDVDSFQTVITLPRTPVAQELFGYAHSSVTGEVSVLSVPIAVGVDVGRAGDVQSRTPVTECRTGSVDSGAPADDGAQDVAPPPDQAAAPAAAPAPDAASTIYLDVANPGPGDSIHIGAQSIQGLAFDSAADGGVGIDHVDIFLDNRDAGGVLVGHATFGAAGAQPDDPNLTGAGWAANVVIPPRTEGPHTLFFYALSAVTGAEMTVGVPVQVVR